MPLHCIALVCICVYVDRSSRIRIRVINYIRHQVTNELRILSSEGGSSFMLGLCNRCLALLQTNPPRPVFTQLASLELIDSLLDLPPSSSETVLIRIANALRQILQSANEPALLVAASAVLGHLARLGSPLTIDLVNFQTKAAFEVLQQTSVNQNSISVTATNERTAASVSNPDMRELSAVLVLKQLASSASTLFNPHMPTFIELIVVPLHSLRSDVREAAALALRAALTDIATRAERWKRSCYLRIFAAAQAELQPDHSTRIKRSEQRQQYALADYHVVSPPQTSRSSPPESAVHTARVHGSLLMLGELLDQASTDFLAARFRQMMDIFMQHRLSTSRGVQRCVLSLLPRAAKLSPSEFQRDYLPDVLRWIEMQLDTDQRDTALLSLGRLATSMGEGLLPSLPTLLPQLASTLALTVGMQPTTTAPPSNTKASSFFGFSIFAGLTGGTNEKSIPTAVEDEEEVSPNAERNKRYRRFTSAAMACIGMLATALGEQMKPHLLPLLDGMFNTGLSQPLIDTLTSIGTHIPTLLPIIQNRLLDMLSTLLHQAWLMSPQQRASSNGGTNTVIQSPSNSAYGFGFGSSKPALTTALNSKVGVYSAPPPKPFLPTLPNGRVPVELLPASSRLAVIRTPAAVVEHDRAAILLALRTLSSFDWSGQEMSLLPFARQIVQPYLDETEDEIRLQAAVTMATLIRTLAERLSAHHDYTYMLIHMFPEFCLFMMYRSCSIVCVFLTAVLTLVWEKVYTIW
jgi:FKBP12-rapamycin complex-associated protein